MSVAWIYLILAILLEVAGTTCMKFSEGFTKILPSVMMFVFYAGSFVALTYAVKTIDIGLAYAVWAAVGITLIAIIGILYFKEPVTALKIVSIGLIIIGVVGLYLSGTQ
ncbi:Multidrug efflux transporter [groundwater metagenome]|uniref:Multidrug efflux transporter n=1 Tax=groundwater metagenome TaxID=717931 RepID=A0A098E9T6_9ZZZZ